MGVTLSRKNSFVDGEGKWKISAPENVCLFIRCCWYPPAPSERKIIIRSRRDRYISRGWRRVGCFVSIFSVFLPTSHYIPNGGKSWLRGKLACSTYCISFIPVHTLCCILAMNLPVCQSHLRSAGCAFDPRTWLVCCNFIYYFVSSTRLNSL